MAEHDAKAAAKEAAAVAATTQAIEIIASVVLVGIAIFAHRAIEDPATETTWRMKAARAAEGRLARLGIWALAQAERQRLEYRRLSHD